MNIDLTLSLPFLLSFIASLTALIIAVSNWRRLPLEIEKQKQQLTAQTKLDEADLATKVQAIYEKEIIFLKQQAIDTLGHLELLRKQIQDLQTQLQDERTEHECAMKLLRESYESRIALMQSRISELENQVRELQKEKPQ